MSNPGLCMQSQPSQRTGGERYRARGLPWVLCVWLSSTPAIVHASPHAVPATAASAPERTSDLVAPRLLQLERVEIRGDEQVARSQIQRVLERAGLAAGVRIMWPEDERIARARSELRATGYFERVTLRLEPVPGSTDRADLVVDLEERSTVALTELYLGSSDATPFRGGFELVERNLLGKGIQLGGGFVWGTLPRVPAGNRQQGLRLFIELPRLGTLPFGLRGGAAFVSASEPYRVSGSANDPNPESFRALDYSRLGGTLGMVFPVLSSLRIGIDYRFEYVDALLPTVLEDAGEGDADDAALSRFGLLPDGHRLTSAHVSIAWDGRREAALAGKGGRAALDLQLSSPALGSSYEYIKLVAGGAYTFRLPWRHWLTPSLLGGQIAGASPLFEQFYAGDLSDWVPGREFGLRYSTRNPIDVFHSGIDTRTFGSLFGRVDLEYVWPVFRRTRTRRIYGGDVFFAAGIFTLVEDRATRRARVQADERVAPLGFNANIGVRLDTAIGTFDISIGNVLRRTPL